MAFMKNGGYESNKCEDITKEHSCVAQDLKLRFIQRAIILGHSRRVDSYICPSAATLNYRSPVSPAMTSEYFMA